VTNLEDCQLISSPSKFT